MLHFSLGRLLNAAANLPNWAEKVSRVLWLILWRGRCLIVHATEERTLPESENAPYGNLNLEAPVSCWPQVGTIYPTQVSCQEFIKKLRADSRKDPNERKNRRPLLGAKCFLGLTLLAAYRAIIRTSGRAAPPIRTIQMKTPAI
jgi:hypothetical protein